MSVFSYKALNSSGTSTTGEIEARNRGDAILQLEKQKLQPVSISEKSGGGVMVARQQKKETGAKKKAEVIPKGPIRLGRSQVILFTEELSDLLDAGLQLESALRIIEDRQEKSGIKQLATMLRQKVRDGASFSDALRQSSPSFGELFCSLCSAGELSGALPRILKRQVVYLNIMQDLRNQIVQALIYPAFIVTAGIVLMFLFMTVLVPKLTEIFEKGTREIPAMTKVLIGTSDFVSSFWWLFVLLIAMAWIGFTMLLRNPEGKIWWDHTKLKIPLIGPVMKAGFLAQFCQTLSNLVGNGLPLLTGLKLMEKSSGNAFYSSKIERISTIVADGGAFSRAMKRVGGFPDVFIDLVGVGEQTGDIGASLEKAAARYEKEMTRKITRITSLIQPVVIVCIALLVGIVVYSIITSIFEAISSMRRA